MRFRCKMNDTGSMRDFMSKFIYFCFIKTTKITILTFTTDVSTTIARMSKMCVIRVTPDAFYFNVADESTSMVWAKLEPNHFFVDYDMYGKSDDYNEIYMELVTAMLAKSVTSLKTAAQCVKIKLTNKQQPCLTFEIELASLSAESRQCVHDVPVTIISPTKWNEYNEPCIEKYHVSFIFLSVLMIFFFFFIHFILFQISLEMPQFRQLKSVVERIKNMSPILEVQADANGVLAFKADADAATITVHFSNLAVMQNNTEDEMIMAKIDIKKFHAFVAWEAVHPTMIRCNMLNERVININLSLDDYLQIRYYIPAVAE